jgi:hypothetical protein
VGTEISFGKSEIKLGAPVNKRPDGQITGGPPRVFPHAFFKNSVRSTIVTHLFPALNDAVADAKNLEGYISR